jgi:hypothetical protein
MYIVKKYTRTQKKNDRGREDYVIPDGICHSTFSIQLQGSTHIIKIHKLLYVHIDVALTSI